MPSSTPLRFRARAAGAALVVTVAALGVDGAVGTARAADPVAQVWVTTPDGSKKLTPEGNVPFTGSPRRSTSGSTRTTRSRSSPARGPP